MFHTSHLAIVQSRLSSGVLFPAFGIDLVFVAVVSVAYFSLVGLKTFFRFSGLLCCAVYQGDLSGFWLITDTDNELTDLGGMFDVFHFGNL
jgi:hypothetical protein